jgi:hypothetical protein
LSLSGDSEHHTIKKRRLTSMGARRRRQTRRASRPAHRRPALASAGPDRYVALQRMSQEARIDQPVVLSPHQPVRDRNLERRNKTCTEL